MSEIHVRRARREDAPAILELESAFPSDRLSQRSVRDLLRSGSARVWVAEEGQDIVGNLVLLLRKHSRIARIYSLVVAPAYRGRRIGEQLLHAAETSAIEQGRKAITLQVRLDAQAARKLYARSGYFEVRALPEYYDDGADGLDLRKTLFQ